MARMWNRLANPSVSANGGKLSSPRVIRGVFMDLALMSPHCSYGTILANKVGMPVMDGNDEKGDD
jgi:hypothetical protein